MTSETQTRTRSTAHTFEQVNWENAEQGTRIGVLQEMVAILLNRLDDRDAALREQTRITVDEVRPFFEKVADTMDHSEARPGGRFADMLREAWREMFDAVVEAPKRAVRLAALPHDSTPGEPE